MRRVAVPDVTPDPAAELLARAVQLRASDLHLDPAGDGLAIRARVDGRFVSLQILDGPAGRRLVGRLKVMAELMVYRTDVPQEGRLSLADGREARFAVIPTLAGEKATIRLFDVEHRHRLVADLGLGDGVASWLRERLAERDGLLLVVGPSGSGKTTTLYAALAEIAATRGDYSHLTSIEDPVERRIPGVSQVQVDPLRGLDFAAGLKFLLRQDPEVVMVGEIRDAETARVAVRAGMTGHLVLSTLHCGHAAEARPRLLEMGVEGYALDLALRGVLAQRLLRRVCGGCGGVGCEDCLGTGARGRVAVAEVAGADGSVVGEDLPARARALVATGVVTADEAARVLGRSPALATVREVDRVS